VIALEPPTTPSNTAPVVSAGSAQTVTVGSLPASVSLSGSASEVGKPTPPGALTLGWSKVSGPGAVAFTNATSATTDGCTIGWVSDAAFGIAVGDIDDDGVPDIVTIGHCGPQNSPFDRILAIDGRTGALKWRSPSIEEFQRDLFNTALLAETGLTIARLRSGEKPSILVGRATAGDAEFSDGIQRPNCASIVANVTDGYHQAAGALTPPSLL
jgi:hypothetical protein